MHRTIYTLALLGLLHSVAAQQDYSIYLQAGSIARPESLPQDSLPASALAAHRFADHYYLVLQFSALPTTTKLDELAAMGITLHGYLPNYAYLARIPAGVDWSKIKARWVIPLQGHHKLSKALAEGNYPSQALRDSSLRVQVHPFPGIALPALVESLQQNGWLTTLAGNKVQVQVPRCCLLDLAEHPAVLYVEAQEAPPTPEGWVGRTAQRINAVSAGPGLGLDGSGVAMAIGDDGKVIHEDFRGRLTDFNTTDDGNHGDMTAGLAIGAGNLNPLGMGMAPGTHLYLYPINDYPHLENAVSNLQQRQVVLTSTSYGEGCGGVYTTGAQQMDAQLYTHEALLHFFSAGNSGEEVCSNYSSIVAPDGGRFGTITGGRKVAKNTITVGNTAYDDELLVSSSRGPTADGRLKPDLCAHGQGNLSTDGNNGYRSGGGTSAAAPSLAGTAALLYQAFREKNGNVNPSSALVKALLLNTADDLGNAGPDYRTGFGRIHAARAVESLQNNWYTSAAVANGATQTHSIPVPPGTQQVRVMLYWHDPEALPNAAKALVNDLDATLKSPSGTSYMPWVLSRVAHVDSLNKPAYRGVDRVNNVEQITLETPEAGVYTLTVRGNFVPKGPQKYVVVYTFLREELRLAYPQGGEGLVPGETETIRWDALGNTGTFTVEYSTNGGTSWQTIATNIAGNLRHYDWKIPAISVTKALVRVSRNGKQALSAQPFCILELPNFQIVHVSANQAAVRWRKVPGANTYDVFALGNRYMEVIGTTSDTAWQVSQSNGQANWYSVRARHSDGAVGRRAFAKQYIHQLCDAKVTLQLNFDLYPGETFWDVKDASGKVWASGGPYEGYPVSSSTTLEICLPYGCYNLNIYDAYNDGMCCSHGAGSYQLKDATGTVLAAGGQFGNIKTHSFCAQPAATAALQISIVTQKNVSCAGGNNGAVSIAAAGGMGSYTYRWSNGASGASLNNLAAGTYSVTVSDGVRQQAAQVVITQPTALEVQLVTQQGSCTGGTANAIIANTRGGTAPYRYAWSNGSQSAQLVNVAAGTYTVTVSDANGCTQMASAVVQPFSSLGVAVNSTSPTCANTNNGTVAALPTGGTPPYTYAWSTGSTGASLSGLSPGTYRVTVSDQQGCQSTATATLLAPEPLSLTFAATQAVGTNNGSINLTISGGKPAYRFRWSNGAATEDLNNLGPGTYTVTVTDAHNCTAIGSQSIDFQEFTNCPSRGSNTRFEWIQSIRLGDFLHNSGNNGGYGSFVQLTPPVQRGSTLFFELLPGYTNSIFREYWRIWIDFNRDGDFLDANEEVLAINGVAEAVSGHLNLPHNVPTGLTRMRVSMRYGSSQGPCGTFPYGEVEDYSIVLVEQSAKEAEIVNRPQHLPPPRAEMMANAVKLYPNPASTQVLLEYFTNTPGHLTLYLYNLQGKLQQKSTYSLQNGLQNIEIDVKKLSPGTYLLHGIAPEHSFTERLMVIE